MKVKYIIVSALLLITACNGSEESSGERVKDDKSEDHQEAKKKQPKPKTFSCDNSYEKLLEKNALHLKSEDKTVFYGYRQVSKNNKDPIMSYFKGEENLWCKTDYEVSGDDSEAYAAFLIGEKLYVAFSSTGSQGDSSQDFRRFAKDGWLKSYGKGGGAKVAVLARLALETGQVEKATFISAWLESKNRVNSIKIREVKSEGEHLRVHTDTAFAPRCADTKVMDCSAGYPNNHHMLIAKDLDTVFESEADNCTCSAK